MKNGILNRISPQISFVIIAVCFLASLTWIFAEKMNQIENHIYSIKKDVKKISSYVEIPTLRTAEFHDINGFIVRLIPYDIKFAGDLDYFDKDKKKSSQSFELSPYFLTKETEVEFHPKQWGQRLIDSGLYVNRKNKYDEVVSLIQKYIDQGRKFSTQSKDALYFGYPFEYVNYGKRFHPPWYSGIAQGFCLAAFVKLYHVDPSPMHKELAQKTFNSFMQIRQQIGQKEPWVTFIDENQYLWFEEYPHQDEPQLRVLNGHIYAIMGLYSYYREFQDPKALALIRAGITTVQRYFNEFRRPGQTNNYCLLENSKPDYKPSRSIIQMQWLADITNDPTLQAQADAFKQDMSGNE